MIDNNQAMGIDSSSSPDNSSALHFDDSPNHIDQTLARLDEIRTHIADLEAWVAQAKQNLAEEAERGLRTAPTDDQQLELATQIYWFYEDIPSSVVYTALNVNGNTIKDVLPDVYVTVPCRGCKAPIQASPTSRSNLKELRRGVHYLRCPKCEAARAKESAGYDKQERLRVAANRAAIAVLKAMPYSLYLKTPHWQNIRQQMLRRARFRCQLCNSGGVLNVHHRTYERRGEEDYKDLVVLCQDCHSKFHHKLGGA